MLETIQQLQTLLGLLDKLGGSSSAAFGVDPKAVAGWKQMGTAMTAAANQHDNAKKREDAAAQKLLEIERQTAEGIIAAKGLVVENTKRYADLKKEYEVKSLDEIRAQIMGHEEKVRVISAASASTKDAFTKKALASEKAGVQATLQLYRSLEKEKTGGRTFTEQLEKNFSGSAVTNIITSITSVKSQMLDFKGVFASMPKSGGLGGMLSGAGGLGSLAGKALPVAGAVMGAVQAFGFLKDKAKAADDASDRLAISLSTVGLTGKEADAEVERLSGVATELSSAFGLPKYEIMGLQSTIAAFGNVSGKDLDKLTEIAIGASGAMGMSSEAVAKLIAKGADPEQEATLKKLGLVFDANATSAERMDAIQKKFGASIQASKDANNDAFGSFNKITQKAEMGITALASILFEALKPAFDVIGVAIDILVFGLDAVVGLFKIFNSIISFVVGLVKDIAVAFFNWVKNLDFVQTAIRAVQSVIAALVGGFNDMVAAISSAGTFVLKMLGLHDEAGDKAKESGDKAAAAHLKAKNAAQDQEKAIQSIITAFKNSGDAAQKSATESAQMLAFIDAKIGSGKLTPGEVAQWKARREEWKKYGAFQADAYQDQQDLVTAAETEIGMNRQKVQKEAATKAKKTAEELARDAEEARKKRHDDQLRLIEDGHAAELSTIQTKVNRAQITEAEGTRLRLDEELLYQTQRLAFAKAFGDETAPIVEAQSAAEAAIRKFNHDREVAEQKQFFAELNRNNVDAFDEGRISEAAFKEEEFYLKEQEYEILLQLARDFKLDETALLESLNATRRDAAKFKLAQQTKSAKEQADAEKKAAEDQKKADEESLKERESLFKSAYDSIKSYLDVGFNANKARDDEKKRYEEQIKDFKGSVTEKAKLEQDHQKKLTEIDEQASQKRQDMVLGMIAEQLTEFALAEFAKLTIKQTVDAGTLVSTTATTAATTAVQASGIAASTAATVGSMGAIAAAATPAATAVSVASFGGAAGTGIGALLAALAAAVAAFAIPAFRDGGLFRGEGGPTDDANIIAISDEEYILNNKATRSIGVTVLDYMNRTGELPKMFGRGGFVDLQAREVKAGKRNLGFFGGDELGVFNGSALGKDPFALNLPNISGMESSFANIRMPQMSTSLSVGSDGQLHGSIARMESSIVRAIENIEFPTTDNYGFRLAQEAGKGIRKAKAY